MGSWEVASFSGSVHLRSGSTADNLSLIVPTLEVGDRET